MHKYFKKFIHKIKRKFLYFHVNYIRKFIRRKKIKHIILNYLPKAFIISESLYLKEKDYEYNIFHKLCDNRKISLDIGALWGAYSYKMQKYSKKVFAFEPNKEFYKFLYNTFSDNKNIKVFNYAISNVNKIQTIRIPQKSPGNATIDKNNTLNNFTQIIKQKVKTKKIDSMNIDEIGFVKIDIEGHELKALEGMENTLKKYNPNLVIEVEERHNKKSIEDVKKFLKKLGYDIYFFSENILKSIDEFELELHQNLKNRGTIKYINNFICIPSFKNIEEIL